MLNLSGDIKARDDFSKDGIRDAQESRGLGDVYKRQLWHVGVEYKWWEGPKTCASGPIDLSTLGTGQSLLDSLNDPVKPPACSEAVWHFLGLSMAGWNMIISTAGALGVGLFGLRKK